MDSYYTWEEEALGERQVLNKGGKVEFVLPLPTPYSPLILALYGFVSACRIFVEFVLSVPNSREELHFLCNGDGPLDGVEKR